MSYQALLFCLDERLSRVVTHVFSELDFTVEQVNEPFAAVKKLMAQRYDAVVVDCENEPNATLLFKSARNSSSNQSSLALALVEGQAGVAKAYRIGANLVLTKPINVEQAKGTLRVARGLLRKNADAAPGVPPSAKAAPAPAAVPFKPAIQNVEIASSTNAYELPQLEAELPSMAASSEVVDRPVSTPAPEVKTKVVAELDSTTRNTLPASLFEAVQPSRSSFKNSTFSSASGSGAASAPAPAKEVTVPAEKKSSTSPVSEPVIAASHASVASSIGSSPSFAALDDQDSSGSGGNKKILIVAAVILVAAVLGYFGWTSYSKSNDSSQAIGAVTPHSTIPAATIAATPAASEPISIAGQAVTPPISKPSASISTGVLGTSPDAEAVTTKKPAIVVKPISSAKHQAESEEAAPQVPSPLALATPNDQKLSGLVSSVPSALPTAKLTTLKISQGVSQGLLIKRVQPRYPQNALSMRLQGAVLMQATINKEGNISNLKVLSGDAVLARAASDAVHQWRYKPYYLNGEPVEIETQITVNFKLPN